MSLHFDALLKLAGRLIFVALSVANLVAPSVVRADDPTATSVDTPVQREIVWPKQSSRTDTWLMAESARLQHMSGTVILSVVIGTDGKTSEIKVNSSSGNAELDEGVAHAMEHFIYIPGTINGQPVPMRVLIRWHVDGMLGMAFPKILHP